MIKQLISSSKTIAIVGLSPKKERPSNKVAQYLMDVGYRVIPVNPGHKEILGERCYGSLLDIPIKIDIVDVFRASEYVLAVVDDAIQVGAKVVWLQLGISHKEAEERAAAEGIAVIKDLCLAVEHQRLF